MKVKLGCILSIQITKKNYYDGEMLLLFNPYKDNIFRIYEKGEKISNRDYMVTISKDIVGINYLLFFFTRPNIKKYIESKKKGKVLKDIIELEVFIPRRSYNLDGKSMTIIIRELLLAESKRLFFTVIVLSGSILEYILKMILKEKGYLKKENLTLGSLIKIFDEECLFSNHEIKEYSIFIKDSRNMIHPNLLEKESGEIENISNKTIDYLEKILYHFAL